MPYNTTRKGHFRFTEALPTIGNGIASYCKWGALITVLLATTGAHCAEQFMSEESMKSAIQQHLNAALETRAEQGKWRNSKLETVIRIPSAVEHLPLCQTPLVITANDNHALPIGNLKRSVSCEDSQNPWRINIAIKASLTLDVVVAKSAINRDEPISRDLVQLETRKLVKQQDFFPQLEQVTNKIAIRRIRAGQILDARKLTSPALVEKGNQVVITATKDGFTASTKGVALEQGQYGEQIEVRNSSSGKIIKAVVVGRNQVQTQF